MYHHVHEPISVIVLYTPSGLEPRKFLWRQKTFVIDEITLSSNMKDGGVRKRCYSVITGANVYRLEFNRESERWWLEEIWVE